MKVAKSTDLPTFGGPADRPRSAIAVDNAEASVAVEDNVSRPNRFIVVADVHRSDVRTPEVPVTRVGEFVSSELVMRCNSVTRTRIRNTTIRRNDEEVNCIRGAHVDQAGYGNTATGRAAQTVLPWSKEGLVRAQRVDPDIGFIMKKLDAEVSEKPVWEDIALKSQDVKTLWGQWTRLAIRNGLLKRRFETADGLSERWQVV